MLIVISRGTARRQYSRRQYHTQLTRLPDFVFACDNDEVGRAARGVAPSQKSHFYVRACSECLQWPYGR